MPCIICPTCVRAQREWASIVREVKSEKKVCPHPHLESEKFWPSLPLGKYKVKMPCFHFFEKWNENDSRSRSEISREFSEKSREIRFLSFLLKSSLKYGLNKCKVDFFPHDFTLLSKMHEDMIEVKWRPNLFHSLFSRDRSKSLHPLF